MGNVYKPVVYLNTKETATPISKPEDIDRIKRHKWFTFNCIICGAKVTIAKRNDKGRVERYKTLLCQPCYAKKVKLEKFGDPNFNNRTQAAQTCLKNYGSTNWGSSEEGIAKKKEMWNNLSDEEKHERIKKGQDTYEQRTGFRCSFNNPDVQTQIRETFQERYGCDYSGENPELLQKSYNTYFEKTGYDHPSKNPDVIDKKLKNWEKKPIQDKITIINERKKTNIKRFGGNAPACSDEVKQKIANTSIKKFGVSNIFAAEWFTDLRNSKCLEKYGTITPNHNFVYYGETFHSTWELAVWIYCIEQYIPIAREPIIFKFTDIRGNERNYIPDFMINNKLVEIKGDQYFNPDGTMRYPYTKLHHDSDPMTPIEKVYYDDLYERKHQCGLSHGVEFWKGSDCQKYIEYCNLYHPGWQVFFRRDNPLNPSYWCSNILNPGYYQRQDFVPLVQSATPYAKPDVDGYVFSDTEMVTPLR